MSSYKESKNYKETRKITEVSESGDNYYSLGSDSLHCGLKKKYGVKPVVGDLLTVHTKGGAFGTIRGMDLNAKKIFWKTDTELDNEREEWLRKNEERKQEAFKKSVAIMDAKYDALPKVFQDRIDRFRRNNDRFLIDYESYEMFCCEQGVLIAEACKTKEKVREFKDMSWDDQMAAVKDLDGHSGNTFGSACALAYLYLDNPENVTKMHGAISPLVGSKEHGDIEKEDVELEEFQDDLKDLDL